MGKRDEITGLLLAMRGGDREAKDRLFAVVYSELRQIARRHFSPAHPTPTLDTSALVHETYLKMVGNTSPSFADRRHFFAVAARAMRHILVDYARERGAGKRGGQAVPLLLDETRIGVDERSEQIVAVDEALQQLGELDPRLSQVVELRFFGGYSVEETARILEVSDRTVKRDWRKARAILLRTLGADRGPE